MAEDSDVRLLLDNFPSACSFCSEWLNVQFIPKRCKKLHTNVCFDSAKLALRGLLDLHAWQEQDADASQVWTKGRYRFGPLKLTN